MKPDEIKSIAEWVKKDLYPGADDRQIELLKTEIQMLDWASVQTVLYRYHESHPTLDLWELFEQFREKHSNVTPQNIEAAKEQMAKRAEARESDAKEIELDEGRVRAIADAWTPDEFERFRQRAIDRYPHIKTLNRPRGFMGFGTLSLIVTTSNKLEAMR